MWRATELCLRGTLKKKKWIKLFFGTRWHFGRTLTRSRASSCSSRSVFSFQFHWLHERGSRLQHVREMPRKTPEFTFKRTHKLSPDVPVLYLKVCEQIKGCAVGFLLTSQSCERAEIYEHQSEDKSPFFWAVPPADTVWSRCWGVRIPAEGHGKCYQWTLATGRRSVHLIIAHPDGAESVQADWPQNCSRHTHFTYAHAQIHSSLSGTK